MCWVRITIVSISCCFSWKNQNYVLFDFFFSFSLISSSLDKIMAEQCCYVCVIYFFDPKRFQLYIFSVITVFWANFRTLPDVFCLTWRYQWLRISSPQTRVWMLLHNPDGQNGGRFIRTFHQKCSENYDGILKKHYLSANCYLHTKGHPSLTASICPSTRSMLLTSSFNIWWFHLRFIYLDVYWFKI